MKRAIELAKKGEGYVNPNPMVGAVIVKGGRIIGEGYHERFGALHAERNAFASLTEKAEGADLYVTLEPCCHHGKTPPCTEAIIENRIGRVVIGSRDPNPLVAGKGAGLLREAGIEVTEDYLKDECDSLNPVFFKYITTRMPYVVLKYAMTMDGKIATVSGQSKWITSEASRNEVQYMRHRYMAIMAGIGTVIADDPMLNTRVDGLRSPLRVICDSNLRISPDSNIVKTASEYKTVVAYCSDEGSNASRLEAMGVSLEKMPSKDGHIDMKALLKRLGELGTDSVIVEGGGTLNDSLLRDDLIDRAEVFVAPRMFGGSTAPTPVGGKGIADIKGAPGFELEKVTCHGADVHLSYVKK
ncbi:MAG: bifunctional diaminohydroxyphosphoribosylaminopyrimidine deaminase/5-amino-6-(5-phosphoribosylamino)uracil reductase RibD [Lachnospiraceae bacterium]|nr:bifunctional diaminohydroxyphosphoribosylaminopyrimidine deaminase/5-amino-6-(5-phosphoribosylamino)uracil reductase RibD [Lachnospiraceae bacterium]